MFIKQLVQLRGLSVEKALAIVEKYNCPKSLMMAYERNGSDKMLADISAGNLKRKIGPVISKAVFDLYNKPVLLWRQNFLNDIAYVFALLENAILIT